VCVLKFLHSSQTAQWRSYLFRLPPGLLDIHFYPEMVMPYEKAGMGQGMLAVIDQGRDFLIQPFLQLNNGDGNLRHPYNFGGPIATEEFELKKVNVNSISTFNPFLWVRQQQLVKHRAVHIKNVVWIDLTKPLDLRQTTRHSVEKAEASGVTVELVEPTSENIEVFSRLYVEHMQAVDAAEHFRFPKVWFEAFFSSLGKSMSSLLFAKHKDEVVGACILLHDDNTCYYHFAVSKRTPVGIAARMVVSAVGFAKEKNHCRRLHLGGGVEPTDGLYRFKAGFSDLRAPVFRHECKRNVN